MSPDRGDRKGQYDQSLCRPFRAPFDGLPIRGLRFACPRLLSEAPPGPAHRPIRADPQSHVWATASATQR